MSSFWILIIIGGVICAIITFEMHKYKSKYLDKAFTFLPILCFAPAFIDGWFRTTKHTEATIVFAIICFIVAVFMFWKKNADALERQHQEQRKYEEQKRYEASLEKRNDEKAEK